MDRRSGRRLEWNKSQSTLPGQLKNGPVGGRYANRTSLREEPVIKRRADRENSPASPGPGLEHHHLPTGLPDKLRRPEPRETGTDNDNAITGIGDLTRPFRADERRRRGSGEPKKPPAIHHVQLRAASRRSNPFTIALLIAVGVWTHLEARRLQSRT
jgi:hypothetical protein